MCLVEEKQGEWWLQVEAVRVRGGQAAGGAVGLCTALLASPFLLVALQWLCSYLTV